MASRLDPLDEGLSSAAGFRFSVLSALIRNEGYSASEAEDVLRIWQRYARYAMLSQKSPASTAQHLARFERYQRRSSPPPARDGHDDEVHPALVDQSIADDLRAHADALEETDPEHARELHHVSDWIEFSPDARMRDPAQIAADALLHPRARGRATAAPRCEHSTEIVSLIFPPTFDVADVEAWARSHGFRAKNLEFSKFSRSTRAPQRPASAFKAGSFRTILLSEGENIRAVIGCPRSPRVHASRSKGSR